MEKREIPWLLAFSHHPLCLSLEEQNQRPTDKAAWDCISQVLVPQGKNRSQNKPAEDLQGALIAPIPVALSVFLQRYLKDQWVFGWERHKEDGKSMVEEHSAPPSSSSTISFAILWHCGFGYMNESLHHIFL